jgi:hypothetical protein
MWAKEAYVLPRRNIMLQVTIEHSFLALFGATAIDQVQWMVLTFTVIIIVAEWITIATAFRTQLAKIIKRPW